MTPLPASPSTDRAPMRDLVQGLFGGPVYEPPYATPLHDALAWQLVKVLPEDARLLHDAEVETPGAFYTVDFLIEVPTPSGLRRVALELGQARAPRDRAHRLWRDATLVATEAVDAVYRLRGSDLADRLEDVLFLISRWDPTLVSERGRINLATLASREARALRLRPEQAVAQITYVLHPDAATQDADRQLWHAANGVTPFAQIRRLDRRFPQVWQEILETKAVPVAPARAA